MLSYSSKLVLMFLGFLAGFLVVINLTRPNHYLLYLSALVTLVYILFSIWVLRSAPTSSSDETPPSLKV